MFKQFFTFEVRFWLRSWMLWVFFLIVGPHVFRGSEHRPDHRRQRAEEYLPQRSLGDGKLLRGLQPADAADDDRVRQLSRLA